MKQYVATDTVWPSAPCTVGLQRPAL